MDEIKDSVVAAAHWYEPLLCIVMRFPREETRSLAHEELVKLFNQRFLEGENTAIRELTKEVEELKAQLRNGSGANGQALPV